MRSPEEILASAVDERTFSNHSEYDIWAARWCYECRNDDDATEKYCPILGVAMLSGKRPAEWTTRERAWTVGEHSGTITEIDTCTEFDQRDHRGGGGEPDPEPPPDPAPEIEGQLDIIDAYLDTALNELTDSHTERSTTNA